MPPASSSRKRARQSSAQDDPASPSSFSHLAPLYDAYAGDEGGGGGFGDDLDLGSDEDEEEEDLGLDDEVDEDGDELDGVVVTPSRRNRNNRAASQVSTPDPSPSKRRGRPPSSKRKQTRTPRKTALELDPSAPGFVRPTAADAYFLAAARPARRGLIEVSLSHADVAEGEAGRMRRRKGKGEDVELQDEDGLGERAMTSAEKQVACMEFNRKQYAQWHRELDAGFNLIVFGHGSKRLLLNDFVSSRLAPAGHCIVINGLYPGLTIKDVLLELDAAFPDSRGCPVPEGAGSALEKAAQRVYAYFLPDEARRLDDAFPSAKKDLYLVLNNLDGPGLRIPKSLDILALLALSPRIHLVASFDHANTPILFSTRASTARKHVYPARSWTGTPHTSRGFAWAWHEAHTFAPYTLEVEYAKQASAYVAAGGGAGETVTEEGALRVLHSVTTNARRLFKLVLQRQVEALPNSPESEEPVPLTLRTTSAPSFAMDGDLLQTNAREKMIATQEERYNALMTEYKDHGLVVEFGSQDEGGRGRWIWVPLGRSSLVRLIESMHDVED